MNVCLDDSMIISFSCLFSFCLPSGALEQMTLLRELYWLWIVVGMVLSALLIALLFIIINKCISKKGNYFPC